MTSTSYTIRTNHVIILARFYSAITLYIQYSIYGVHNYRRARTQRRIILLRTEERSLEDLQVTLFRTHGSRLINVLMDELRRDETRQR